MKSQFYKAKKKASRAGAQSGGHLFVAKRFTSAALVIVILRVGIELQPIVRRLCIIVLHQSVGRCHGKRTHHLVMTWKTSPSCWCRSMGLSSSRRLRSSKSLVKLTGKTTSRWWKHPKQYFESPKSSSRQKVVSLELEGLVNRCIIPYGGKALSVGYFTLL